MIKGLKKLEAIKESFGKYFSQEILTYKLLNHIGGG